MILLFNKLYKIYLVVIKTPFFERIIFFNFFSSFLTVLGIPLLVPALQFLQNPEINVSNNFVYYLKAIFNFINLELSFHSIIIFAASLILSGQLLILLIELFSKKIQINLNKEYMNKMVNFYYRVDWSWMLKDTGGKFQSTLSREIFATTETHLDSLRFVTNIFQVVFFSVSAFFISIQGSVYAIFLLLIIFIINSLFSKKLNFISKINNEANINLLSLVNSIIINKKFLKSSKNFENFSKFISNKIVEVNKTEWKLSFIDGSLRTFSYLFGVSYMIIIFIFHQSLNIGFNQIIVLLLIFSRLIPTFTQLISNYNRVIERLPIYDSVNNRIEKMKSNFEKFGTSKIDMDSEIIFKDVNFDYGNNIPVLKNINLSLKPKLFTIIYGPSGSGKSTILDLFLGLLKPTSGKISIQNLNLNNADLDDFRKNIAYVSQDTTFIEDSILFNLKLSNNNISNEKIYEICKEVQIYDFIKTLPHGFNTKIGEEGVNLSGGQKQKLAIARALLNNPKILILDEATSNLDFNSEKNINEIIIKLKNKVTILVVTHKFSSLKDSDLIYFIQNGSISEFGSYNELIEKKGNVYQSYKNFNLNNE